MSSTVSLQSATELAECIGCIRANHLGAASAEDTSDDMLDPEINLQDRLERISEGITTALNELDLDLALQTNDGGGTEGRLETAAPKITQLEAVLQRDLSDLLISLIGLPASDGRLVLLLGSLSATQSWLETIIRRLADDQPHVQACATRAAWRRSAAKILDSVHSVLPTGTAQELMQLSRQLAAPTFPAPSAVATSESGSVSSAAGTTADFLSRLESNLPPMDGMNATLQWLDATKPPSREPSPISVADIPARRRYYVQNPPFPPSVDGQGPGSIATASDEVGSSIPIPSEIDQTEEHQDQQKGCCPVL